MTEKGEEGSCTGFYFLSRAFSSLLTKIYPRFLRESRGIFWSEESSLTLVEVVTLLLPILLPFLEK